MQDVSKKEMCDFLTLKMLPLALVLIKTKNHQKMLILHENLEFLMPGENFPMKKVNFWRFFVLINARANGNILSLIHI